MSFLILLTLEHRLILTYVWNVSKIHLRPDQEGTLLGRKRCETAQPPAGVTLAPKPLWLWHCCKHSCHSIWKRTSHQKAEPQVGPQVPGGVQTALGVQTEHYFHLPWPQGDICRGLFRHGSTHAVSRKPRAGSGWHSSKLVFCYLMFFLL